MVLHSVCHVFPLEGCLLSIKWSLPKPRLKTQNKNHVSYTSSLVVNILGILPLVGQVDNFTVSCEIGYANYGPWFLEEEREVPAECCDWNSGKLQIRVIHKGEKRVTEQQQIGVVGPPLIRVGKTDR